MLWGTTFSGLLRRNGPFLTQRSDWIIWSQRLSPPKQRIAECKKKYFLGSHETWNNIYMTFLI
jgi:hypothetical protein